MQYRDSSVGTHFTRGVAAMVDSSHGVKIDGGSTGGLIQAIGDDANIALTIQPKGTGPMVIGGANSALTINSTTLTLSGGTLTVNSTTVAVNAGVTLGSTGNGVTLNSSASIIGSASTTGIAVIQRYRIDWTVPALSSAGLDAASADSTITVTGATTNGCYIVQPRGALNSSNSTGLGIKVVCSTANEIRLTSFNIGASTISGSTMSAYLLQFSF